MKIATTLFFFVVVGFTVGDELGFQDSLTNLEVSRRRSVQTRSGIPSLHPNVIRNRMTVPPFKPLPPGASRPMAQQPERQRLVVQQNFTSAAMAPRLPAASQTMQEDALRQHQQQQLRAQQEAKIREQQRLQQEMLAMQVLKQQRQQQQEAMKLQRQQQQQQQVQFPQQALPMATKRIQQSVGLTRLPSIVAAIPPSGSVVNIDKILQMQNKPVGVIAVPPAFISMPESAAQLTDRISNSPTILEDSANEVAPKDDASRIKMKLPSSDEVASSVNQMTLMSLQPIASVENPQSQTQEKRQSMPSLPSLAPIHGMETSLKALAEASNITLEALEAAILLRQQQLLQKQQGPSTTTTTTHAPVRKQNNASGATKVMNAPREYYPVGYDKNFDDNFASRVDLPDTTFYCGDQKHFPGLYADEDLGCMVFHVCALTDDGLIMKSFLCPESTLFDQTILKCNWWFYVDCKTSKGLYDSNIPISKSYQLMKALAFFSAYKSHDNSTQITNDEDS